MVGGGGERQSVMNEWELSSCFKLLHSYFEGYTTLIADL